MSNESPEGQTSRLEDLFEFVPAVLMAAAVILTAFSAYQATRRGGVQATDFATASSLRAQATTFTTIGVTEISYDAGTFGELALAFRNDDFDDPTVTETLGQLAEALVRDEFRPVLEEWLALDPADNPDAPGTPFDLPSYSNANLNEADRLIVEAEVNFNEAKEANQTGDDYILATIFFASVLFLAGLRFRTTWGRSIILVFASVALIAGMVRMATLPYQ